MYFPENERLEPENTPFGKGGNIYKPPSFGFQLLVFQGCSEPTVMAGTQLTLPG